MRWEYLIVALPRFEPPTAMPTGSAAVGALNREGERGWEAVGMTTLADGSVAVLLKRLRHERRRPPAGATDALRRRDEIRSITVEIDNLSESRFDCGSA